MTDAVQSIASVVAGALVVLVVTVALVELAKQHAHPGGLSLTTAAAVTIRTDDEAYETGEKMAHAGNLAAPPTGQAACPYNAILGYGVAYGNGDPSYRTVEEAEFVAGCKAGGGW